MPYVGQKPADIISTAVDTVTGKFSGALDVKGAAVFNEDSADVDFRVESNDSANMLFVNGGNNQVGIGVDAASTVFHVETSTDGTGVSGDEIYVAKFYNREATDSRSYGVDIHAGSNSTDQALRCKTHDGGTQLFLVKGDGSATIANGLTLTDGNLVVANGHGIDFSATANAGGMTSELLDSYEEGTFTPTLALSGATLASTGGTGRYTKIGRHVYVEGKVTRNTADGGAGSFVQLESLPFTSLNANSITEMGSGTMWMDEGGPGTGQGDTVGHALVASNGNVASVLRGTSSGAQTSARYGIGSEMTNGRPLYFNFVYTTA